MSPPISAANTGSLVRGEEVKGSVQLQGRDCALPTESQHGFLSGSCQDAISPGNAGEMDGASTAVLVLGTEHILVRKKTPRNKNYSAVLEIFYRNRGIF